MGREERKGKRDKEKGFKEVTLEAVYSRNCLNMCYFCLMNLSVTLQFYCYVVLGLHWGVVLKTESIKGIEHIYTVSKEN